MSEPQCRNRELFGIREPKQKSGPVVLNTDLAKVHGLLWLTTGNLVIVASRSTPSDSEIWAVPSKQIPMRDRPSRLQYINIAPDLRMFHPI